MPLHRTETKANAYMLYGSLCGVCVSIYALADLADVAAPSNVWSGQSTFSVVPSLNVLVLSLAPLWLALAARMVGTWHGRRHFSIEAPASKALSTNEISIHNQATTPLEQDVIYPPVNLSELNRFRSVIAGDDAFFYELVAEYLQETARLASEIRQAQGRPDEEAFRRLAHSIRSSSQMLGAEQLARMCEEMENMQSIAAADLASLDDHFHRVSLFLSSYLHHARSSARQT